ncbi:MAG TPA: hypothetical protein VJP76_09455, partial [Candidatus Tumulicola sp.]|nr:hypothetical protein [Candidatus Tumulicola sp.]
KTIGVPLQDNSSGTDGLLGVRVIDNIGINPGETLNPALIPANPPNGSTFVNPYPYDCFVTIIAGATTSVTLIELNGVVTGSTIAANNQKSFPVKAGGSISVTYGGASDPTWTWVGL